MNLKLKKEDYKYEKINTKIIYMYLVILVFWQMIKKFYTKRKNERNKECKSKTEKKETKKTKKMLHFFAHW